MAFTRAETLTILNTFSTWIFQLSHLRPASQVVLGPAEYIDSLPSKNVRDLAADALNVWLDVPADHMAHIKDVVKTLHNASLMQDDVEDGSALRRGKPAAHMIFGTAQTINAAGYQVVAAIGKAAKLNDERCVGIVNMYMGQAHDIYWSSGMAQPSAEEYLRMVDYKTGGLFRILASLMSAKSSDPKFPAPGLIMELSTLLGRYFQIRDDYMNLSSTDYTKQKGFCEDLDEGKFSLIMIHTMENAQEYDKMLLQGVLDQRHLAGSMSEPQKELVLELMQKLGSLQYTRDVLQDMLGQISKEVAKIEEICGVKNKPLGMLLQRLGV
ncbi:terpenoid synthase [Apiospora rasikravindrae]|uniref:Terpenoid synthase n=1 Tax=Apiospora rasikravindrae TaxID=990691 RepID=A0ABR1RXQ8_9PEZI